MDLPREPTNTKNNNIEATNVTEIERKKTKFFFFLT